MDARHSQSIQDLKQSFKLFNHVSERLEASYQQLGSQVNQLHAELQGKHCQPDASQPPAAADEAQRLRAILSALPAGVVVLDGTGRVQECNPAALELLGEPLLGEVWNRVIQRVFAPRTDDGHEISLKDGRRVSISTCPLGFQPGQVLLFSDVTETRELQDKLSQHKRLIAMGEMAASLAHQIRTPLASGLLFSSQLKNSHLDNPTRLSIADKVIGQLRHLELLINDMLMYSRAGYGGDEDIEVEELLNGLASTVHGICQQRNIKLSVTCEVEDAFIIGNSCSVHSALLNLVNNAVQAIDRSGNLQLLARHGVCDTVEICVIDDGPGIEKHHREKLFQPFFTTRSNGTGLGLAVVQAVARAHGGGVHVVSEEGRGSSFIVQLPLLRGEDIEQGDAPGSVATSIHG